jgi:hypothetical protein
MTTLTVLVKEKGSCVSMDMELPRGGCRAGIEVSRNLGFLVRACRVSSTEAAESGKLLIGVKTVEDQEALLVESESHVDAKIASNFWIMSEQNENIIQFVSFLCGFLYVFTCLFRW